MVNLRGDGGGDGEVKPSLSIDRSSQDVWSIVTFCLEEEVEMFWVDKSMRAILLTVERKRDGESKVCSCRLRLFDGARA
jgi:hypothetical protein